MDKRGGIPCNERMQQKSAACMLMITQTVSAPEVSGTKFVRVVSSLSIRSPFPCVPIAVV